MAAYTNRMSSFTITQPFLGAPLHFQPALGSQELEALIDAYVAGPASKQDKLSEVTIDFYNRATVDLSNGSLVRRYDVALQSPMQSQSSGFSPIYTPSPGSSATFGDSGNASVGTTPPNRSRTGRVSKKTAKKDTKKAVELKLPGFSIMTKDGIDVTSSAGRGTKTKEQREHAHMMRIMKACEECKRKKVRCDPSHRSSSHASSTASTNTTKTSSPSWQNYSPASIGPGKSQEVTPATSAGDFILFPESNSAWNPADLSVSYFESQPCDLSNFDFDINNIGLNEFTTFDDTLDEVDTFDWSFTQQTLPVERYPSGNSRIADPFGIEQWAGLERLSPVALDDQGSTSLGNAEQHNSSANVRGFLGVGSPERARVNATIPIQSPDQSEGSPGLSFSSGSGSGSGSLEGSATSLSSSSYATSFDWTADQSSQAATNLHAPNDEALTATSHDCILISGCNHQVLASLDERHSRSANGAIAAPRQELATLSVLHSDRMEGLASDGEPLLQEVEPRDRGGIPNRVSQLEVAGLILLPVLIITILGAASLAVLPLVSQLVSPIFSWMTVPEPSRVLVVAALMLQSSIGSSKRLVESSKHTPSKLFRRQESSHWHGSCRG